jgi:hypothetical protein
MHGGIRPVGVEEMLGATLPECRALNLTDALAPTP